MEHTNETIMDFDHLKRLLKENGEGQWYLHFYSHAFKTYGKKRETFRPSNVRKPSSFSGVLINGKMYPIIMPLSQLIDFGIINCVDIVVHDETIKELKQKSASLLLKP